MDRGDFTFFGNLPKRNAELPEVMKIFFGDKNLYELLEDLIRLHAFYAPNNRRQKKEFVKIAEHSNDDYSKIEEICVA